MTNKESAQVLAAIRGIWPRWSPSDIDKALWIDALQHWGMALVLLSVQEIHKRGTKNGFPPELADVLSTAAEIHRQEHGVATEEERHARHAREALHAEQDARATSEWLGEQPVADVDAAKKWLCELGAAAQQAETIDFVGALFRTNPRHALHLTAAAVRSRAWERQGKPWQILAEAFS